MCTSLSLLVTAEFNVYFIVTPRYCRIQCVLPCHSSLLQNSMCTSLSLIVTSEFNVRFLVTHRYFRIQCVHPCHSSLLQNSICTSLSLLVTAEFYQHFTVTPRNCRMPTYLSVHLVLFQRTTNVPGHASLKLLCDMIWLSCHIALSSPRASYRLRGQTIALV